MKHYFQALIISIILFFYPSFIFSQKNIYFQNENDYHRAMELFQMQKYGSAAHFFNRVISQMQGQYSIEKTNSQYYLTICAIRLCNNDAELLLTKFLTDNPESNLRTSACFEMGKYQYDKKDFKKAVHYFDTLEVSLLNDQERSEFYFKSGYSLFINNNLEKARVAFFEIKDVDNKYSSPAIYYYSHIAYIQKNYETALQGFRRLIKDETFASIVPYYIAQCYYYQNKYDELLAFAVPIIDSVKKSRAGEIAKLIADAYYYKNKYKESLPYFERYVNNTSSLSVDDNYEIGYCNYKTQQYERAIKYLEKASIGESRTVQNALYQLADCYIQTKDKVKARMAFQGASSFDFDGKIKEDALFDYAVVTYELSYNPFNEAIKAFNEYITLYPTSERSDEAYNYLTLAYLNTRNYKDAMAYIEKIKVKDNTIRKAYQRITYFRALELFNNLRYQEAIELLRTSLLNGEYDPVLKADAYFWIGEAYYRLNNSEESLTQFMLFLNHPAAQKTSDFILAHYNMGYVFFKEKQYSQAAMWFKKYITLVKEAKTMLTGDAFNRLADCYFENKQFPDAIEQYTKAIVNGQSNKDYAIFQKAFSLGIQGKIEQKISYLNELCSQFPLSPYVDDATYEIGNCYLVLMKNDLAMKYFSKVVTDYSSSEYVKKSLLQMGLIYYNQDKSEDALKAYKQLVADYPGTLEAKSALTGIKNIYIQMNKIDDYFTYAQSLGQFANISLAEQDSLTYNAGENFYMQGDCEKSVENFNKYIEKFPQGSFIVSAWFYKAECLNKQQDLQQALEGYNFVISKNRNNYTESALLAAGKINMLNQKFQAAVDDYVKLESQAELPANILLARLNLQKAYFELKEYDNVITVAKRLLPSEKLTPEDTRITQYMLAKAYLFTNSPVLAFDVFKILAKDVKNSEGAEAKYTLAQMLFNQQDYNQSEKEILDFGDKNTPHQYWIAKAFILLSDIYLKKKDEFQANQTLQSIIENYDNKSDGIIDSAKVKLHLIEDLSVKQNQTDSTETQIRVKP